jgi:hypothetical protein
LCLSAAAERTDDMLSNCQWGLVCLFCGSHHHFAAPLAWLSRVKLDLCLSPMTELQVGHHMVVNGVRQLVAACACLKQAPTPFGALRPRKSEWWTRGPLPARWNIPDRERPQRMIALASWRQQLGPSVAVSHRDLFGDGDRVATATGHYWRTAAANGGRASLTRAGPRIVLRSINGSLTFSKRLNGTHTHTHTHKHGHTQ